MPNEKIHDIDAFRMEGDTPEPPKDPTPQRHCAAEFDGLGSKAGGLDVTHISLWKKYDFLMFPLPQKRWVKWMRFLLQKSLENIMSSKKKCLDFFEARLGLYRSCLKGEVRCISELQKLRPLWLPGWSGSWSKTSGRFQTIESMALWIIFVKHFYINQYHSKKRSLCTQVKKISILKWHVYSSYIITVLLLWHRKWGYFNMKNMWRLTHQQNAEPFGCSDVCLV